jgi:hypothetical protein
VFKKSSRIALATALGASVLVAGGAAVPAQAKTVKACVNKSTGELRILTGSKNKCKKGWKKISWNKKGATGPQGNQGAQGPNLVVKDGTGKVLGKFLGLFPAGFALMFVEIDGGSYLYAPNGTVYPFGGGSPAFKTNTCTGTGYVRSSSPQSTQLITGSAGGPTRLVYRKSDPPLGPTFAWAFTATTETVNQVMYTLDSAGNCVADGNHNGTIVALQSVAAPPDVPGPLTIG